MTSGGGGGRGGGGGGGSPHGRQGGAASHTRVRQREAKPRVSYLTKRYRSPGLAGLQLAVHKFEIASNRESAWSGIYVPGFCTHSPVTPWEWFPAIVTFLTQGGD